MGALITCSIPPEAKTRDFDPFPGLSPASAVMMTRVNR